MHGNQGFAKMISHKQHRDGLSATRWACNPNWSRRGDNTKSKEQK